MRLRWLLVVLAMIMVSSEAFSYGIVDTLYSDKVKSVYLTRQGIELEMPIVAMGSTERLLLQFDILGEEPDDLHYEIYHCNRFWQVDSLEEYEYLLGMDEGRIDEYDFSFTTTQAYVHYHKSVPSSGCQFIHSGNYLLRVYVGDGRDSVLMDRRFYVSENAVTVRAEVTRPYDAHSIQQRQEVDVCVQQEGGIIDRQYTHVYVQQNGRTDNGRWLKQNGYEGSAICYRQTERNIFEAGNTFRFFDISSLHTAMYNTARIVDYGGETYVMIKPEEVRAGRHYLSERVLMGGSKIHIVDRENDELEADYTMVSITLPMATPYMDGSVHVVGDWTDWSIGERSRMEYDMSLHAYCYKTYLKQGYYSYLLVFVPSGGKGGTTERVEGNYFQTPNRYSVFVYYRTPSDRADRLLRQLVVSN